MNATCTFEIVTRTELPLDQTDGTILKSVVMAKRFWGDIAGESAVQMLGYKTAIVTSEAYLAFERLAVTVAGRTGGFVLRHCAMRTVDWSEGSWKIVPDSGTGQLAGISGSGTIAFQGDGTAIFDLDYELA
ncbi:DUF3224 domain-containing protein [Subtercola sp. YIM 133946]|uniref:DUF3224 domain-containing protein n=1 Tax=Subtercola sp. YIM 133946 TaxID=3118909 RepID=UPI002F94EB51